MQHSGGKQKHMGKSPKVLLHMREKERVSINNAVFLLKSSWNSETEFYDGRF